MQHNIMSFLGGRPPSAHPQLEPHGVYAQVILRQGWFVLPQGVTDALLKRDQGARVHTRRCEGGAASHKVQAAQMVPAMGGPAQHTRWNKPSIRRL